MRGLEKGKGKYSIYGICDTGGGVTGGVKRCEKGVERGGETYLGRG